MSTHGSFSSFRLYDQQEKLSKLDQDDRRIATSIVQRIASNLVIMPWDDVLYRREQEVKNKIRPKPRIPSEN
jgi:hypothetical protein